MVFITIAITGCINGIMEIPLVGAVVLGWVRMCCPEELGVEGATGGDGDGVEGGPHVGGAAAAGAAVAQETANERERRLERERHRQEAERRDHAKASSYYAPGGAVPHARKVQEQSRTHDNGHAATMAPPSRGYRMGDDFGRRGSDGSAAGTAGSHLQKEERHVPLDPFAADHTPRDGGHGAHDDVGPHGGLKGYRFETIEDAWAAAAEADDAALPLPPRVREPSTHQHFHLDPHPPSHDRSPAQSQSPAGSFASANGYRHQVHPTSGGLHDAAGTGQRHERSRRLSLDGALASDQFPRGHRGTDAALTPPPPDTRASHEGSPKPTDTIGLDDPVDKAHGHEQDHDRYGLGMDHTKERAALQPPRVAGRSAWELAFGTVPAEPAPKPSGPDEEKEMSDLGRGTNKSSSPSARPALPALEAQEELGEVGGVEFRLDTKRGENFSFQGAHGEIRRGRLMSL